MSTVNSLNSLNSLTAPRPGPGDPPNGAPGKGAPGPGNGVATSTRDAPAFDFYPERWLVGVAGMSDAEQISYLRLLCHQWLLGDAGLPEDAPALRRLAGGKGVTPAVLAKLPQGADGRRRNARLEVIRAEQRERIAKSRGKIAKMNLARAAGRGAGAKGGKARKGEAAAEALHEDALDALQDDLHDALQGGLEEGLREDREEALQGGLEGRFREGRGDDLGEALDVPHGGHHGGFLTSHHSPPTSVPEPVPAAGARARTRPTLEEARAAAREMGITPDDAETWWLAREASEWLRSSNGALMPVGENWRADAKTFVNNTLERRRHGGGGAAKPRNQAYQRPAHVSEADTQF